MHASAIHDATTSTGLRLAGPCLRRSIRSSSRDRCRVLATVRSCCGGVATSNFHRADAVLRDRTAETEPRVESSPRAVVRGLQHAPRMRPVVLLVLGLVACHPRPPPWYGSDGPQVEPTPPPRADASYPGKRCQACFPTTLVAGFLSVPWSALTLAIGQDKLFPNVRTVWPWIGIGLGTTTIALGGTHAVLNRGELASTAVVPLAVAVATGVPALVLGIVGLASDHAPAVGSAVACRGARCTAGVPAPMRIDGGAGIAIAAGAF